MGIVCKKCSSKILMIHNLSWLPGKDINHYINVDDYHVHYMSVDDVVEQMKLYGPHCQLAKLNVEDKFKHTQSIKNSLKKT